MSSSGYQFSRNILGAELRKYRLSITPKVTQANLAARLQIQGYELDRSAISRIENDERHLMDFEFLALCNALRVAPEDILANLKSRKPSSYTPRLDDDDMMAAED